MSGIKFLRNLYDVASSPEHKAIVWNKEGNGIVIVDKVLFIEESLSKICKTDEYGTFVRQLNNYGFSKLKNRGCDEFVNEKFLKDSVDSLLTLKRKSLSEKPVDLHHLESNQKALGQSVAGIDNLTRRVYQEVCFLRDKVERQDKTIHELIKAFIKLFNQEGVKKETLRLEGASDLKNILTEITDQEETEDLTLDHFLNNEFDHV
ncbi:hypothetical protein NEDG_00310 [Nematocida displodere]|uniref:HSF-type DNA-binding domain-containing protein n=1 Tax=Nematocida displodere TaxID=1805483 RepID=A0A177EIQ4_9MICR|nr:hypothetical protein NEDG_00310 [Nematocida displodere]